MSFSDFLLSLEDQDFFAVMRNYLGPLQTPFNKHDLIRRLQSFLSREETAQRIAGYLDQRDRELIAAVRYFGEPTERDLLFFFSASEGYLDLHNRLLNLQDRLILLADRERHTLRLNPILLTSLEHAVDAGNLVPVKPLDETPPEESWLQPSLTAALFAFLREFPELLKGNGTFRKRAQEAAQEKFPILFEERDDEGNAAGEVGIPSEMPYRFSFLLRALKNLKLLRLDTGVAIPSERGFNRLASLKNEKRLQWSVVLGALRNRWDGESFQNALAAMEELLRQLDPELSYDAGRLGRYFGMILAGHAVSRDEGPGVVAALTAAGVLREGEPGYLALAPGEALPAGGIVSYGNGGSRDREGGSDILLSPNFEVTLPAEAPVADHAALAKVARVLRYDRFCRYEITRHAFLGGCRNREEGEKRVETLRELVGVLPQNVATTISAWVAEFGAFRLLQGVVLQVSGDQATLVEHAPAIQPYIREKLAEGIYLMAGDEGDWRRALGEIGFEQLPPVERDRGEEAADGFPFEAIPGGTERLHFAPGAGSTVHNSDTRPGDGSGASKANEMEEVTEELGRRIERLKTGEEVKQELQRRLELKLLLYPEQLENQAAQRAAAEARGLDYLGKLRIIESALSNGGDLLEAVTRKPGSEPQRILLRPRSLEKGSSDVILHGVSLPDNRPVKLQVRKIALLRKLTGTLIRSL